MRERFLPIGTIVSLHGSEELFMITSYCIFPSGKQEVQQAKVMYEYGACAYPEGILNSDTTVAFNHNQIEKIIYLGYETEAQKELSNILNNGYDAYKQKYETNN